MKKVAVLSGGSSGIGRETAKALVKKGYTVYELSRSGQSENGIIHIDCDVTKEESVRDAAGKVLTAEPNIHLLVNNAGMGISGAIEFTKESDCRRQLDVNFHGMDRLTKAFLPAMREQGFGRIVNISSVAAVMAIPFQVYYSASKAAINMYTQALANEIRPYGITVCAVMPGDTKTGFTSARQKEMDGDEVYGGRISRSVNVMEKDEQSGDSAEKAGSFIAKIAEKKSHKPLYIIGFKYKLFYFLFRLLPSSLSNYILYLLYAK